MTDAHYGGEYPRHPRNSPWTTEQEDVLRGLVAEGLAKKEICLRMNLRGDQVEWKKKQLGLCTVRVQSVWTIERKTRLSELVVDGLTAGQIGAELGITRNAAISAIKRAGFTLKRATGPRLNRVKKPRVYTKRELVVKAERFKCGAAIDLPPDESPFKVSFNDMKQDQCRWPMGHVGHPGFGFCGAQKYEGYPYCARHCRLAYVEPRRGPVRKGGFRLQDLAV